MKTPRDIVFFIGNVLLLFPLMCFGRYAHETSPLEISVSFHLNKIYDINSMNETYLIDGYLVLLWEDPDNPFPDTDSAEVTYENSEFPDNYPIPTFEFINVLGKREILNKQLKFFRGGKVMYNERFHAKFTADMDFHLYPVDRQVFNLQIEAFSKDIEQLVFTSAELTPEKLDATYLKEWTIMGTRDTISKITYEHFNGISGTPKVFSRCTFEIITERKFNYYFWQVLLPIFLIIIASWLVFWVNDFSNQLNISFTLMLTVVAFNFFTSTLLPRLPYNTFIEIIIISGYTSIFLTAGAIIFNNAVVLKKSKKMSLRLIRIFRWLFPLLYTVFLAILISVLFLED
ncbi:gamma-aminobutyric-acid receptor subunit beta [Leptobacterium flavescens]|uniref:Gamma-aminobutyric-acid receptor subunit beta n=1 Tax=Leptobacterium flavescens TaxID=472055 RepID=A0A6P0UL58_9FLAO|nr:gamma-aminobutyric-acid receptor subunit beta [Leptobacterium flavescens]NER13707.1 gamma-aminobutyric-acid receptor subunit beta [Leptobacterium flavescens]